MAKKDRIYDQVYSVLSDAVGTIMARSICKRAFAREGSTLASIERQGFGTAFINNVEHSLKTFCRDEKKIATVRYRLKTIANKSRTARRDQSIPRYHARDYDKLCGVLTEMVGAIMARSICKSALTQAGLTPESLEQHGINAALIDHIEQTFRAYCKDEKKNRRVQQRLRELYPFRDAEQAPVSNFTVEISHEDDIVTARSQARFLAQSIGFAHTDQIKISTAVSELGRNIINYAGSGTIRLKQLTGQRVGIRIEAEDKGPGIANLAQILAGQFVSKTGLGLGLVGCKRLMDEFSAQSEAGKGTNVTMVKYL